MKKKNSPADPSQSGNQFSWALFALGAARGIIFKFKRHLSEEDADMLAEIDSIISYVAYNGPKPKLKKRA
jgi:hypothetical protein